MLALKGNLERKIKIFLDRFVIFCYTNIRKIINAGPGEG
jgi:hypothetical protein